MKRAILALVVLITSCTARAQRDEPPTPQPLGRVDFPAYEKRVLPNGLTVLVAEDPASPVAAINLWVQAGYFDETDEEIGISHVIEHMFFNP